MRASSSSSRSLLHTVVSGTSSGSHGGPRRLEDVATAGRKKLKSQYDAVIVGGGHNGLTCAAYLAKAGLDVLVLERRHLIGGAAVTEEIFPGFKFSRASYLCSLFRPQIIKELELKKHGFEVLPRDPYSFTPLRDGRSLLLSKDPKVTREQIAQFSKKDAEVYGDYEQLLSRLATAIEPLLDMPPPNIAPPFNLKGRTRGPPPPGLWQFVKDNGLSRVGKYLDVAMQLGIDLVSLFEIMTAPASTILNRWFESEPLKATLATDAIVGAMVAPSTPSSGYVLFHHVMGETNGEKGVWAYVRGGMGTISQSLASVAKQHGATILIDAPVRSILTNASDGTAKGVVLEDGTEIAANIVISNATPDVTFHRLLSPEQQKGLLPNEFRDRLRSYDYTSPVTKINVALGALPQFKCMPWRPGSSPDEVRGGRQHRGTIHLGAESLPEIEEAYRDAAVLNPSRRPVVEMTLPSVLDSTVAPPGKHVAQLFVQYTPYQPAEFDWSQPGKREAFAERVFNVVEEYCPGFKSSIEGVDILTPPDLERVFGLTGGNIGHGAFGLDQLYWLRPAAGYTNHRSPIPGLYLCGAGCHPGGGVMGAPGRNASKIILNDQGLPTTW